MPENVGESVKMSDELVEPGGEQGAQVANNIASEALLLEGPSLCLSQSV